MELGPVTGDPSGPGAISRRSRRLGIVAALLVVASVLLGAVIVVHRHRTNPAPTVAAGPLFHGSTSVQAPSGVRIKVEVLNATRLRGLGRRATLYLRDRGFDVVSLGTSTATRDTTLVIDRSGHPAYAELVAQGLGGARVESHPDSSRYVDVSVLVGAGWRPPPQPFYP